MTRHEELADVMLKEPEVPDIVARSPDRVTPPVRGSRTAPMLTAVVVAALLGVGIYEGIHRRAAAEAQLAVDTTQDAVPIVDVVSPRADATDQELVLPGQTMAFTDTPIYARTNGYLKRWFFDIGARVHQGQLLAQIETPELDAQLRQARADLETAQANSRLAGITAQRTATLLKSQSVSMQERDNAAGAMNADQAIVSSRQAEVARLEELQSYENVYAPFDGEITARNTDVGDLINAGAGAPTTELFHMTATKTLRIFVAVPEIDFPAMQTGATPTITLDEYPGQVFHGRLARTSNSINPASRTLLVEVDIDNDAGKLLPGAYVFVHFTLPGRTDSVTVPANALLFRSEGLRVGVVRNGKAELLPITVGRDYGDRVEVLSGLHPTDQVILNPSDSLTGGVAVRLAGSKPAGAA
jgi:RND family efflux transporter MFP subunit